MISREDEHVSLRMEHQNFAEVSDKEDGGHDDHKTTKGIQQHDPSKFHRRWDRMFLILCAMALFLDPLYCYIPSINADGLCYYMHIRLWITFCFLRSIIDLFYVLDICIFSGRILRKRNATTCWGSWSLTESEPTISDRRGLGKNKPAMLNVLYKLSLIFHRIFLAIPIPQAIILTGTYASIGLSIPLLVFYPIQYALRAHSTYILLKENRPNTETDSGRWVKAILDFIPFFIAAHLFGAVWYYFSLDRQIHCWRRFCIEGTTGGKPCFKFAGDYDFRCAVGNTLNTEYRAYLNETCAPGTPHFNYGIYTYSLENRVTAMSFHPRKVFLCFWWGLRNLSSFGSNLETSPDMIEATVSVLVSISGMALFLVYLNARVQESQERKKQLDVSQKLKMMNPDIDLWLSKKGLPKDMNQVIRERVRRELKDNKHVDVKNFLAILPLQQREIMYQIHLSPVKKVPILGEMNERVLKAICRHLEPVTYPKNSYIIHAGEQLWNVLFITQGTVLSYTRKNTDGGARTRTDSSFSSDECLEKGDFYGEELVTWAFNFGSFGELPVSKRTVMSKTKVEAFTISANELATIASEFQISISRKFPHLDHYQLEILAASYIQEAWRRHYAIKQARGSTS